jgi:hypothetical protein
MTTLAAVLVRQRALPLETVEQAMQRQSLFGGDLATNLLELGSADEAALLTATATALEVPAMAVGGMPNIDPAWLQGLTPAQLLEDGFVPIGITDTELFVATSTPLPQRVVEDLEARLGKRVVMRAALEIRIRQALSRVLEQPLDERTAKLLARLDLTDSESPTTPIASAIPTPRVSLPAVAKSLVPVRVTSKGSAPPRRLGPFTAAMAEIELTSAQSPGDVITVWLDFVAQYFEYTAVFAVQGDIAAGKAARGTGTVGEAFSRIGVPLDLPSAIQRVKTSKTWQLTTLEPRGLDRTLARDLGRNTGRVVLLVPVCIRDRVVLLTYGDHGDEDVLLDRVGDVLALQPLVERHLERMLYERKRGKSLQPPQGRSDAATEKHASLPGAADRANALAQALASSEARTGEGSQANTAGGDPSRVTDPHEGQTLRAPAQAHDAISIQNTEATSSTPALDTVTIDESWDLIQPVLSVGDGEPARNTRAATNHPVTKARESSPPGSVWPGASTRPGLMPRLELVPELDADSSVQHEPPDAQATQTSTGPAAEPARDDSAASSDEQAIRDQLDLYLRGNSAALDELIAMGDAALSVLVRELPGPIVTPSRAPRLDQATKASESGPLLRAIAAFGPSARPHLIARSTDNDAKVRVWAIRLLGDLPGRLSAVCVAERIVLDRDAEVRRAAYLASQQLLRDPDSAAALREKLLATAGDSRAVITQRLAAIDALADLRDSPAIPNLIQLLADANPGTAAAAQQALSVLARQDFGYDARTWTTWWQANCSRDRIEWVIDALDHRSPAIRQAASEELRLISRLYVGNFDDDSSETRAKVQKKYRDWWASGARSPSGPVR